MTRIDATRSDRPSPAPIASTPEDLHAEQIASALCRAVRHGRVDLARRLHSHLVVLGREIHTYELADSSARCHR